MNDNTLQVLNQSGIQSSNPALYKVILDLLKRIQKLENP